MANVNTGDPSVLMTEEKPHLPAAYVHGHLTNARANQLFTVTHKPFEGEPKAILLWHHGLSEHISRAQQVLPSLAAVGIAVYGFDAHGHGKSEPTDKTLRSYVDTFEHLIDDFALRLKTIHDEYKESGKPVPPIFVGGNSMGGLVAGMLAARSPAKTFAGLVMLSPLIDIEWTAGLRIQAKIGAFLSYTFPKAPMVPAVRPEDMSQDPKVVQAYLTDPLMYTDKVKCRTAYESLKAMAAFQKAIPTLDIPLYIAHGSSDKCTSPAASKRYFDKSINPDKKYTTVEGGYHELLYGPEHKQVIHDVVTWILEHATGTALTPAEPVTYTIAAAARPAAPAPAVATTVTATTNVVPAAAAATTDVSASVSASASAAAGDASASVPATTSTAATDAGDAAAAMPAAAATAANDAVVPAAAPAPATSR